MGFKETDINDLHQADDKAPEPTADAEKSCDQEAKNNSEGLEKLQKKCAELDDNYKRLWADHQNMVNRFSRERTEIQKYAASSTVEAILPALDNFGFAKKSLNEKTSFEEVLKSIDMLQEQLLMSLKSIGLEEVDTSIAYNPELHEAVSNITDPEKPEGTIVEVLKKGYKLRDKVLRVATVVVSSKS